MGISSAAADGISWPRVTLQDLGCCTVGSANLAVWRQLRLKNGSMFTCLNNCRKKGLGKIGLCLDSSVQVLGKWSPGQTKSMTGEDETKSVRIREIMT